MALTIFSVYLYQNITFDLEVERSLGTFAKNHTHSIAN